MEYNRRSIRLKGFDYANNGCYFVTICTKKRYELFSIYSYFQSLIKKQWLDLPVDNPFVGVDEMVIMPNHIHGILVIKNHSTKYKQDKIILQGDRKGRPYTNQNVGAGLAPALTLGKIIGSFKSKCFNDWSNYVKENKINEVTKFWQRNYYERIIRNDRELIKIRKYIKSNPDNWSKDKNNPLNIKIIL